MFTSRAEYRTLLRQDNADLRLTKMSYELGLASQERIDRVRQKEQSVEKLKTLLFDVAVEPSMVNDYLESKGSALLKEKQKIGQVLLRPNISIEELYELPALKEVIGVFDVESLQQAEIQIKYEVYIEKEKELVSRMNQMESLEIPENFDFFRVQAISAEAREKLNRIRPRTLGQASRISGINPSDVQILMVFMGR
jgi:tRNA uridine 5-carboxymethylaminomethyl modification enzyme